MKVKGGGWGAGDGRGPEGKGLADAGGRARGPRGLHMLAGQYSLFIISSVHNSVLGPIFNSEKTGVSVSFMKVKGRKQRTQGGGGGGRRGGGGGRGER